MGILWYDDYSGCEDYAGIGFTTFFTTFFSR